MSEFDESNLEQSGSCLRPGLGTDPEAVMDLIVKLVLKMVSELSFSVSGSLLIGLWTAAGQLHYRQYLMLTCQTCFSTFQFLFLYPRFSIEPAGPTLGAPRELAISLLTRN